MNLSPREKTIAMVVGAVIALYLLNYVFIEPLLAQRDTTLDAINAAQIDLNKGQDLVHSKSILERQLANNINRGLARDESGAESQVVNALLQWAQDSQVNLSAIKPGGQALPVLKPGAKNGEKEKAFMKASIRATANGSMLQVAKFIYRIQTASIPVRITDFSIASRKDATDDLELNLTINTIFLSVDPGSLIGSNPTSRTSTKPAAAPRGRS